MENASKALIIAGAILISIVLIGVGVLIVGNAQGLFDQGSQQMSSMEIDAFNSTFTAFEGRQTGSNVRTLIQKISTHNVTYQGDEGKQVTFNGAALNTTNVSTTRAAVGVGTTYTVSFEYNAESGLITNVVTDPVVTPTGGSGGSN